LARALGALGHDVTCFIPGHRAAFLSPHLPLLAELGEVRVKLPKADVGGRVVQGSLFPRVDVALWDVPALFDRPALYDHDNALRYIAFSRAAAYFAEATQPDIVVAHDWHAALTLVMLRTSLDRGRSRGIGTVQIVHNNAYQGRIPAENIALTGLAHDLMHADGLEAWGELCMLKGGTQWADRVVAVSPQYAKEIQTSEFGEGLEGAYRARAHRVVGIQNGIDCVRYDPASDPAIPARFTANNDEGKATCRARLLERLKLRAPPPGLLCVAVGRFAQQKGWDVLAHSVDGLLAQGATLVLLGDGDPWIANMLEDRRRAHPDRVALHIGFDDVLARRIYAGADCVLVPSRFEPCGLVQLLAQRYGAVPVAHAVGGLVDTIVDGVTGVLFHDLTADGLVNGVMRVAEMGRTGALADMQRRLLKHDVSWDKPALQWSTLLDAVRTEAQKRL
jgi:starch synthase